MANRDFVIGTRGSKLAVWQADYVQWLLQEYFPEDNFVIEKIRTSGDNLKISIAKEGGKGLYVKELQGALLDKKVDICVHSLKDYPTKKVKGCGLGAVLERGEVRDVFISNEKVPLSEFDTKMKIGTSSLRRKALLKSQGVQAQIIEIRGNVDTRINKVHGGEFDGVVLAGAGVLRLGLENEITEYLDKGVFIPSPGQGAIAVECRDDDSKVRDRLAGIHNEEAGQATLAERTFLRELGGDCSLPLGAHCSIAQFQMSLTGFLADPDGGDVLIDRAVAPLGNAETLGAALADRFMNQGAKEILKRL